MAEVTRRDLAIGGVATLAATRLPSVAVSRSITDSLALNNTKGDDSMATITTKDGATIFYKDWGPKDAQPIVFHHGWPLSSDDWDAQMLFFFANGYRVVAHDRRGHGRSSQVATGHDMDHYASDASAVVEHLPLKRAIQFPPSTRCTPVAPFPPTSPHP